MQDTAIPIITYDPDNNTKIRIRQADFYSDLYPAKNYPKQIQFCDFLNKKVGYFNTSGLNLLDVNGNYNNISSYFTQTGNSLLLCSNKTRVDAGGNLNVFHMTSTTILGTMYTGGTWLNVSDTLNTTAVLSNNYNTMLSQLSTITGSIDNISNIGNYYAALQTTLAAINGIITGVGLILAFNFKEDKFDVQYPLSKRTPTGGEYFNKLSLKYGGSLTLDSNNSLAVNTVEFLTPTYGDLGLMPTPNGITSTSTSYVVVGRLSQPITCNSSLNVSGVTTLSNNTTINGKLNVMGTNTFQGASTHLSSLNVSGAFTCNALSALSATIPSILFTTSSTTINNPNTTIPSILMVSGNTSFNSGINITGRTIIGNDIYNYSDSVFETYKNIAVRKNVPNVGDRIELKCGLGTTSTYLSMEEGYDINLSSFFGHGARQRAPTRS